MFSDWVMLGDKHGSGHQVGQTYRYPRLCETDKESGNAQKLLFYSNNS